MGEVSWYKRKWPIAIIIVVILLIVGVVVALVVVIPKSNNRELVDDGTLTVKNYENDSLEKAILEVQPYNLVTREEEYNVTREKQVIEKFRVEVPHETLDLESKVESTQELESFYEASPELDRFFEMVLYMSQDGDSNKVEESIKTLKLGPNVKVLKLSSVQRENNTSIGKFLSHITALSKALPYKKNILILENNFQFPHGTNRPKHILEHLLHVEKTVGNRWDVIVLGQDVEEWNLLEQTKVAKICRITKSNSTSGYLVNKHYIPRLLSFWLQSIRIILKKTEFHESYKLEHIQNKLQKSDLWIGFDKALGTDLDICGYNPWYSSDDMKTGYNGGKQGLRVSTNLIVGKPLYQKKIAICHIATGDYNKYIREVQKDCYLKFLKGHHIEFFLFTDRVEDYADVTEEGGKIHAYGIERQGYPGDVLHKYHYILLAQDLLKKFDYIYYMDADYRVYQHPAHKKLLIPRGIVCTEHMLNVTEKRGHTIKHAGNPETDERSTACIHPHEKMDKYYSGGFQGGTSVEFLKMCKILRRNIDVDDKAGVVAIHHDESHLNRYLIDNPPREILDQSYVFSNTCMDDNCQQPMCTLLKTQNIEPIMVKLKNKF